MLKYYDELEAEKVKAADLDDEIKRLRNIREAADREIEDLKRQLEEEG
jgi:predicted  nucleic acid-binding Zn-ribbon protein